MKGFKTRPEFRPLIGLRRNFGASEEKLVEFAFQNKDGSLTIVKALKGMSLLDVAHKNDIDLEGACEASLACR